MVMLSREKIWRLKQAVDCSMGCHGVCENETKYETVSLFETITPVLVPIYFCLF